MTYEKSFFDQVIERKGTGSVKWDGCGPLYGADDLIPMWVADTDFRAPKELTDAMQHRLDNQIFGYANNSEMTLKKIAAWHEKRNQINYDLSHIFLMNNVVQAISTVVRALTVEDDSILVLTPSYGPLINTPTASKRQVFKLPMVRKNQQYQVDRDLFEQAIIEQEIKLFILCNPHNPTGKVWTHEELTGLFEICQRHNVKILADEIHSDLIYPDQMFTPAMQVAREIGWQQQLVITNAPTKTFNIAGLQAAYYIVENPTFIELIQEERAYTGVGDSLSIFGYLGIEVPYSQSENYVDTLMNYIQGNYHYVQEQLQQEIPQAKIIEAQATYLIWVDVTYLAEKGVTKEQLKQAMVDHGVAISTGEDFFEEELFMRVNIGCPKAILTEGIKRMVSGLKYLSQL